MDHLDILKHIITEQGLTYHAEFIPMKQGDRPHPKMHWRISLIRDEHTMQFDYTQGAGHVVKLSSDIPHSPDQLRLQEEAVRRTCEEGTLYTVHETGITESHQRQPKPPLQDLLFSLTMDSLYAQRTFFNFCEITGYNRDDPKVRDLYATYQTRFTELKRLLGVEVMETLLEAYKEGYI